LLPLTGSNTAESLECRILRKISKEDNVEKALKSADEAIARHYFEITRLQGTKGMIGGQGRVDFPNVNDPVNLGDNPDPVTAEVWRRLAAAPSPGPTALQLDSIIINTGTISFANPIPVGGWGNLSLFPNGLTHTAGHFHDSGTPSYNVAIGFLVVSNDGIPIQLTRSGRMHGTFESGSRDFDWSDDPRSDALQTAWSHFASGYKWAWHAQVNLDFGALLDTLKQAVDTAFTAAAIIL
jgi:hypothetical protein